MLEDHGPKMFEDHGPNTLNNKNVVGSILVFIFLNQLKLHSSIDHAQYQFKVDVKIKNKRGKG